MKAFFLAVQFLTVIPIRIKTGLSKYGGSRTSSSSPASAGTSTGIFGDEDFGKSLWYFPLVGLILGGILAGTLYVFRGFSPLVIAALIILVSTLLTGGLHLDGFADTCDGLYGFHSPGKRLEIMRDSHIGAMGVIGLVCLLLLKFSLLVSIPFTILGKVLVMTIVFSRWSPAAACYGAKYPRGEGKAKLFIEQAHLGHVIGGGIFVLLLFLLLAQGKGLLVFFGTLLAASFFIKYIHKKIGGMTGDTIGAVSEISEVTALLLANLVFAY